MRCENGNTLQRNSEFQPDPARVLHSKQRCNPMSLALVPRSLPHIQCGTGCTRCGPACCDARLPTLRRRRHAGGTGSCFPQRSGLRMDLRKDGWPLRVPGPPTASAGDGLGMGRLQNTPKYVGSRATMCGCVCVPWAPRSTVSATIRFVVLAKSRRDRGFDGSACEVV